LVRDVGGRDDLVGKGELPRMLRRGIKRGTATDELPGAVEGDGVVTAVDGGASRALPGRTHLRFVADPPRKGIWVELRLGDGRGGGGTPTWVTEWWRTGDGLGSSVIGVKSGAEGGLLIAAAVDPEALAA